MPATVASLQDFRSRRSVETEGLPPVAGVPQAVPAAAVLPEAAGGPERARRFREVALPQLDAAYNLARHMTRDADVAEDIVQDAYLPALRDFDGFRGGDARAWILQIVRNRVHDWARERRLDRTVPLPAGQDEDEAPEIADAEGASPEEALAGADEAAAVRAVVSRLPAPFREALVLREMEELSYREIAAVTGAPIGTVMSRLARARQMFGEAWRRVAVAKGGLGR